MNTKDILKNFMKKVNNFFHKCKFKNELITKSNQKGEVWVESCDCGQKRKIIFDNKGICRDISKIK